MRKLLITLFLIGITVTAFADKYLKDGSGRRIKLMPNNTYIIVYDGEVVKDSKGRKILLRENKTWDYIDDVFSEDIIDDDDGKRIWIKGNGTWGYVKRVEDSSFGYKNISVEEEGRRTVFSGRVVNNSGKDYRSATFNLMVFDRRGFEYRRVGTFTVDDFYSGAASDFEVIADIPKRAVVEYYLQFAGGEEKKKEIEKKKKGKKIIELKMELD